MSIIKLNNRGVRSVTSFGSATSGSMAFIKKLTASGSSTIDFVDGSNDVVLDDTYKEYLFTFKDIHPATDNVFLGHQADVDGQTTYGQTCTNTMFYARHYENDSLANVSVYSSDDQAQGTAVNKMVQLGNDNDQAGAGYLHIFNPSSTTFVKHFISRFNGAHPSDTTFEIYNAGYYNTTSALNTFRFKMTSGNIDTGDICLYGIN